jgi:hypothetical protein
MSWDELKTFAGDPLVAIGAHTVSHCNLAQQSEATAREEMTVSRARIEQRLQQDVRHFAYPYGNRLAAGAREFALAAAAGFKTAVTTRPGMIFPESADHLTALPRVSLNGNYQERRILPVLTSGAATAMWNGFRRGLISGRDHLHGLNRADRRTKSGDDTAAPHCGPECAETGAARRACAQIDALASTETK